MMQVLRTLGLVEMQATAMEVDPLYTHKRAVAG